MKTITPEEKAKELYPNPEPFTDNFGFTLAQSLVDDKRNSFIEGANWMAEEKDKEILRLNRCIDILDRNFQVAEEKSNTQIAALKAEVVNLRRKLDNIPPKPINPPQ